MGALNPVTFFAGFLLAGCATVVPGLANAPSLSGSPETRVHDVIANGHDACERSMFPQGEVLRGHIPPCTTHERLSRPMFSFTATEPSSSWLYWFGACPAGPEPRTLPTNSALTVSSLSAPQRRWFPCDPPAALPPIQ